MTLDRTAKHDSKYSNSIGSKRIILVFVKNDNDKILF